MGGRHPRRRRLMPEPAATKRPVRVSEHDATIAAAAAAVTAAGAAAAAVITAASEAASAARAVDAAAAVAALKAGAASAAAAVDVAATNAANVGLSLRDMVLDHDRKLDALPPGSKVAELLTWQSEMRGAIALMKFAFGTSIVSAIVSIAAVVQMLSGNR